MCRGSPRGPGSLERRRVGRPAGLGDVEGRQRGYDGTATGRLRPTDDRAELVVAAEEAARCDAAPQSHNDMLGLAAA